MIKTAAELADEEARKAIEQIKGAPPPPPLRQRQGNGPTVPQAGTSLDEAIVHEGTESRLLDAEFLAAARRYVEAKQAQAERWKRLLLGTK